MNVKADISSLLPETIGNLVLQLVQAQADRGALITEVVRLRPFEQQPEEGSASVTKTAK